MTTHGMSRTPEYRAFSKMIRRCTLLHEPEYKDYGGRGIRVCQRWLNSFESFIKDQGRRPSSKHSIERLDNNAHYSCGRCEECLMHGWTSNVVWATMKEQGNNRRTNRRITVNGVTRTVTQWADVLGLNSDRLRWYVRTNQIEQFIDKKLNKIS